MDPLGVDWLGLYLLEDIGPGDATSEAVFAPEAVGTARIVARRPAVVAGAEVAADLFARLGASATVLVRDGERADAGATLVEVAGPVRALLAGERVALNVLGRMSGIATATRACMDALEAAGSSGRVAGTRKTTPGFRAFEKQAIRIGGGLPHRMGLWDEAMVKDNHLEACGGDAAEAVRRVRAADAGLVVTCEVESLADARKAARAGADWLLIDNQEAAVGASWAAALRAEFPKLRLEASGGIRPERVAQFGWADRISMGWLTQGAPASDVAMDWSHGAPGRGNVLRGAGHATTATPGGGVHP